MLYGYTVASMSDLPDPNPFAGRYPPPLSRRELRAAWERNPSPEV